MQILRTVDYVGKGLSIGQTPLSGLSVFAQTFKAFLHCKYKEV